jgi:hypothetical protein
MFVKKLELKKKVIETDNKLFSRQNISSTKIIEGNKCNFDAHHISLGVSRSFYRYFANYTENRQIEVLINHFLVDKQ